MYRRIEMNRESRKGRWRLSRSIPLAWRRFLPFETHGRYRWNEKRVVKVDVSAFVMTRQQIKGWMGGQTSSQDLPMKVVYASTIKAIDSFTRQGNETKTRPNSHLRRVFALNKWRQ